TSSAGNAASGSGRRVGIGRSRPRWSTASPGWSGRIPIWRDVSQEDRGDPMTSENHLDFVRAQPFNVASPFDSTRQELDALAAFAQALEAMPPRARLAAI